MYETESYRPSLEKGEQVAKKRRPRLNVFAVVILIHVAGPIVHSAMGLSLQLIVESKPHREIDFYHQK